jgi:hypothetical protein
MNIIIQQTRNYLFLLDKSASGALEFFWHWRSHPAKMKNAQFLIKKKLFLVCLKAPVTLQARQQAALVEQDQLGIVLKDGESQLDTSDEDSDFLFIGSREPYAVLDTSLQQLQGHVKPHCSLSVTSPMSFHI